MRVRRKPAETELAISKRFGRYKDEDEQPVRKQDVKASEAVGRMMEAFKQFNCSTLGVINRDAERNTYKDCLAAVRNLDYTSEDVMAFCSELEKYDGKRTSVFPSKAGMFLSALINNSTDFEFAINITNLPPLDRFGYMNTKKITVIGSVGDWCGELMHGGEITVSGSTGNGAGNQMKEGKIRILGNAGEQAGFAMEGGEIVIERNADWGIGQDMDGGKIYVNGDCGEIGICCKGRIYHKGKNIAKYKPGPI
jgi:hypothetical protein